MTAAAMEAKVMPLRPLNILLVEDNSSDIFLVQSGLERTFPGEFNVTPAHSLEAALPALAKPFDVALLDWTLPGSSDLEALKSLRHAAPQMAIVMLTGHDDEAKALVSLKHGAQDYLVKERADGHLIKRAIRYAIERKHFEDNLTTMANYDGLTGLANRSLFESRLDMALARARRSGDTLGVLFIDLNGFKQINDRMGHEAGDILLKRVAARLRQTLRECDTVARFGGDEFAVLLEGAGSPRNCAIVAQKIIDALAPPVALGQGEATIGASIGIALGAPGIAREELLRNADAAMYRAKESPGSFYHFYTDHMHEETVERLQMEHELTVSIREKTGLCLFYQPKLDLSTGQLAGAEALLRWEHPRRGMLAPAEFMPLLQPSMAVELDGVVVETVCRDIKCWQAAGLKPPQVSVHISGRHWENADMADALLAMLRNAGLHASCLAIEVDELALLHCGSDGFDVLSRVRETGIEVHLDNFGAETSSLKLLTRCPLDAIKIDRQLTADMSSKEQHAILVRALVDLGHQLGMRVVAEGVETERQQQALQSMACDQIQGFVISKPLPAQDFFHWLGNRQHAAS